MKEINSVLIVSIIFLVLVYANKADGAELNKLNGVSSELGSIQNVSSRTLCAEDDNINVPLYSKDLDIFRITATHPTYIPTNVKDKGKNCCHCQPECKKWNFFTRYCLLCFNKTTNETLYDKEGVIIETVNTIEWRPDAKKMNVSVKGGKQSDNVVFLRIYKRIDGTSSWPQVFVLYQDGNARIKPQSMPGMNDSTFGSSVIIGATEDQGTGPQYVDIDSVVIDPLNLTMGIKYRDNTSAYVKMKVNCCANVVEVSNITYDIKNHPFARLRSMWVKDGNADMDHIRTEYGQEIPIMGGWTELSGTWWEFFRKAPSIHNTYSPDIKIEIVPKKTPKYTYI